MRYAAFDAAEALERHLGDPDSPGTAFGYAHCAELDENSAFPTRICRELDDFGIQRYYVPDKYGGRLADYETPFHLIRLIARRDITVAVAHGKTYLGAICVWLSGNDLQATRLGDAIQSGVSVCWGLTERDHGSDLLAGEVVASPDGDGYRLTGEKWLINNATRGGVACLLARTNPTGGPRGFSLFLVDKRELAEGSLRTLPKVATLGIRGADISGLELRGALVPAEARVGTEGAGVELVLRSLQLTRTLCAALSLGGADHALRLAVRFAGERQLYGRSLLDLPAARTTLADAYADHLMCEALAVAATRSIHAAPQELSVFSAAVKYLIPTTTEALIVRLRRLLGARSLLQDVYAHGMFQKVERDHRIVSLFDGNTLVNLHALVNQFPGLVRAYRNGACGGEPTTPLACDLSAPLPAWDPSRMALISPGGSGVLCGLPAAVEKLAELACTDDELTGAAAAAGRLRVLTDRLHERMAEQTPARLDVLPQTFELAEQFTLCLAGATAVHLWLANQEQGVHGENAENAELWRSGRWLHAVLARVLTRLGDPTYLDAVPHEHLLAALVRQERTGRLMSLFGCRLAEATS